MTELGPRTKKQLRLVDMHPTMTSYSTVALIIAKTEPNVFLDKLSSEKRGVINFTLRDSLRHIANCTCWGIEACVEEYNAMLQIGDVIDVVGAKVMAITAPSSCGHTEQRYQPRGTLPAALVVNEGYGYVVKHNSDDVATLQALQQLKHQSHKSLSTVLRLADVRCAAPGDALRPAVFVDLLVAVASLRPVRQLKRKAGTAAARNGSTQMQCLELVVIDTSCSEGMLLTIWNPDWIRRAQHWQPGHTLLHLIDVRISHSPYYNCSILSHVRCTLIYEQPQGPDCQALLAFVGSMSLKRFDRLASAMDLENLPAADEIQTKMTVRQIYERAEGNLQDATSEQFTAVLYAMVTKFDIDGLDNCINKKCKSCRRLIPKNHNDCENEHCRLEFSLDFSGTRFEHFFNINIQLCDHTGTLLESRLCGSVADQLLRINADGFQRLLERKKTELKWRFLLKYFEVKLLVKKPTPMRKNLSIIVVDMELLQLEQLIQKMAVF